MTLSTTNIENQAEVHRAHISELIDELRERVTPGEILDQLLGWDEGHEIARNFGRQVKANPLPLALVGTGVAWLMLSDGIQRRNGGYASASTGSSADRRPAEFSNSMKEGIGRAGEAVADATSDAADYARSAAENVSTAAKDTASQFSDSASSAMEYGRQAASDLSNKAQTTYAKARESVGAASDTVTASATTAWQRTTQLTQTATETIKETGSSINRVAQEQPLLAAGLGFALGVALGALFPTTEMENSLIGEESDAVKQKAAELAGEEYEKAKAVARRSYEAATEAARDEAQNQGLTSEQRSQPEHSSGEGDSSQPGYREQSHGESDGGNNGSGAYPHH
ncbi:MAG TPA: hypothetical protein VHT03_11050 [Rhizomicrobium sp.]|jgi:hypothetical protein|nr:hypothetical protein [Rhizomicrobium sp.]